MLTRMFRNFRNRGLRTQPTLMSVILNNSTFALPLTHTAVPQRGSITPTFTRATTETGQKYDEAGYLDFTALAGEVVFKGARRERNLLPSTEGAFSGSGWSRAGNIDIASGVADPDGGTTAYTMTQNGASSAELYTTTAPTCTTPIGAVWIRRRTGSGAVRLYAGAFYKVLTLTTEWQQLKTLATDTATSNIGFELRLFTNGDAIDFWHPQLNDVTGETDQTTIRPYVSVGALIHNSQDPNYLSLPGTAGHYASSPDSAAASITGDIDIRCKVSMADWTPAGYMVFVAKWSGGAGGKSYELYVNNSSTGKLALAVSLDGTVATRALSSVGASFADGNIGWVRVTRASATGAVNFYTSTDASTWTLLGSADVATTAGAIFDTTTALEIGTDAAGTGSPLNGKVYSAQVYSTIGGTTPVVDFNPDRDATTPTGTITSSTTGEVWTLNGASSVVRNAAYHGSMVDGVRCYDTDRSGNPISTSGSYPLIGYVPWEARTNVCLQSNAFTTAPWGAVGTPTASQNLTGPNGQANYAWTLGDDSAVASEFFFQSIASAANTSTWQIKVKKTTGAQAAYPVLFMEETGALKISAVTVDTTNGVVTPWTAFTGFTINTTVARIRSHNADFWLIELVSTKASAGAWVLYVYPAGTKNATQSTGLPDATAVGTHGFCDSMLELGVSSASSYTPTTTVAVARNADILTYTGADVANIKTLACTFSRGVGVSNNGYAVALSDGSASNYISMSTPSATEARFLGVTGGATQWDAIPAYTAGVTSKVSQSFATNDIKMDKDGTAQAADTTATVPAVTQLNVGHVIGGFVLNGPVNHIYGWTRNLSQSELGAIDRA